MEPKMFLGGVTEEEADPKRNSGEEMHRTISSGKEDIKCTKKTTKGKVDSIDFKKQCNFIDDPPIHHITCN